ncbi:acyltransferase [Formosa haliotis]|uniref:acyltransferase n=1 Tax=Formosa haliotis TaxID=1555194 RepID=UPI000826E0E8|nr:DapH/DapD/GlmU-related protein [Formosa haliotis]
MKILLDAFKTSLESFFRKIYWLYLLQKSNIGKNVKVFLPIIREGKGTLTIGKESTLKQYSLFGIDKKSKMTAANNCVFHSNSEIKLKKDTSLTIGNDFSIGEFSKMFIANHWFIGNNVSIANYCAIFSREKKGNGRLVIGDNCNIGDGTILDLVNDVSIGNDVAIGPNCTLYTHDHEYTNKELPAWKGAIVSKPIQIGDGAWIGSGVTLLPGVKIGKRAVIAASSVVTRDVKEETIVGGIPAKLIKNI